MKRWFTLLITSLASGFLLSAAWAQGTSLKAKPALPDSAASQRPVHAGPSRASSLAQAREAEAVAAFAAMALSDQQLALASQVALGRVACEGKSAVQVAEFAQQPGKFVLTLGGQSFRMAPVVSDSGAIRLEDSVRGVVWLQLANKSMLLDQQQGRRLADGCMNDAQTQVAREMESNPALHLLAGSQGAPRVKVALQEPSH